MQGKQARFRVARMVFYLLLLLFFALLPYEAVAEGFFRCPSTLVGLQCPGCGVTRAMTLLMKGRLAEAFELNSVFSALLFPLFLVGMGQDVFVILTKRPLSVFEYFWRLLFGKGRAN